ncbi:hypothetical protein B0H63DRAFT_520692 [Podospora didyma]|uniref:Uncharacterized protein n=1 Tax=Podospora didyma TaxID=330526 RepID=A0AAE0U0Z5_9PEZI|nr:hypothetical protein B0H63DRAFT_520692 [Podospora didyma]
MADRPPPPPPPGTTASSTFNIPRRTFEFPPLPQAPRPSSVTPPPQSTRSVSPPSPSTPPPVAVPTGDTSMIIALDYGTTFTGIAYLPAPSRQKELDLEALANDIRVIQSFKKHESQKVPSEISYSPSPKGCEQWGYDIDDNSRVLKWTKLELEETKNRTTELRTLAETLYGLRTLNLSESEVIKNNIPRHLAKEPEDIVKDYLDQIAEKALEEISTVIGRHVPERIPIDMIVTHPALFEAFACFLPAFCYFYTALFCFFQAFILLLESSPTFLPGFKPHLSSHQEYLLTYLAGQQWSDRALNSTYRAVRAAFNQDLFPKIRDIAFVSEPEACAHYTLREAWKEDHLRFRRNDCFIVVDAGGGTVDLASYKVVSMDHDKRQIKLEHIGRPIGDKCGATEIDKSFDKFVEDRLGPEDWEKLTEADAPDRHTGGHSIVRPKLRTLHDRFEPIKHQYDGKDQKLAWPVQLPRGIGTIDNEERGILNGAIKVTADDLKEMFKYSVDRTLVLIGQAAAQIEIAQRLKVKKIFLSGGFAQNQYLFDRVKQFGLTRRIDVERGEDCWIAVAKGAIIKSLGVYTDKPALVKSCPRHYGIKVRTQFASYKHQQGDAEVDVEGFQWATDQIRWFIQKGDALFPNKPLVATYDCHWSMKAADFPSAQNKRSSNMHPTNSAEVFRDVVFVASGRDEAPMRFASVNTSQDQVVTLRCDLTKVPPAQMGEFTNKQVGKYLKFWVKVEIHVTAVKVEVKITSGDKTLASKEIPLGLPREA